MENMNLHLFRRKKTELNSPTKLSLSATASKTKKQQWYISVPKTYSKDYENNSYMSACSTTAWASKQMTIDRKNREAGRWIDVRILSTLKEEYKITTWDKLDDGMPLTALTVSILIWYWKILCYIDVSILRYGTTLIIIIPNKAVLGSLARIMS